MSIAPDFQGSPTNIILRTMASSENFSGFNKIIDAEQNIIDVEEMDDSSEVFYGLGNECDDVVCGYFTLLEKVSEVHAEGILKICLNRINRCFICFIFCFFGQCFV